MSAAHGWRSRRGPDTARRSVDSSIATERGAAGPRVVTQEADDADASEQTPNRSFSSCRWKERKLNTSSRLMIWLATWCLGKQASTERGGRPRACLNPLPGIRKQPASAAEQVGNGVEEGLRVGVDDAQAETFEERAVKRADLIADDEARKVPGPRFYEGPGVEIAQRVTENHQRTLANPASEPRPQPRIRVTYAPGVPAGDYQALRLREGASKLDNNAAVSGRWHVCIIDSNCATDVVFLGRALKQFIVVGGYNGSVG